MTVFSKLRNFMYRHRNKFVIGGIIITGSVLLTRYAQQKLREWQEREAKEIMERTRRQQHFESTERTCNQTILNLNVTLKDTLANVLNTESIVTELRGNCENKLELWEKLKVLVFTRASCLIYLQVMMVLTLRIQLSIIGGQLFQDTASIPEDIQQRYLSLTQNLLTSGIQKMSNIIQCEFKKIIGPMELKRHLKLKHLDNIFWAIQSTVATKETNPIENFKSYVINEETLNGNDTFTALIRDTADLLESEEVKTLANHCINRGFVLMNDRIAEYYTPAEKIKEVPSSSTANDFVHPTNVQISLAKLIPIINGLVSENSLPDQLIQQLIMNQKLTTLSANVYECFSNVK